MIYFFPAVTVTLLLLAFVLMAITAYTSHKDLEYIKAIQVDLNDDSPKYLKATAFNAREVGSALAFVWIRRLFRDYNPRLVEDRKIIRQRLAEEAAAVAGVRAEVVKEGWADLIPDATHRNSLFQRTLHVAEHLLLACEQGTVVYVPEEVLELPLVEELNLGPLQAV